MYYSLESNNNELGRLSFWKELGETAGEFWLGVGAGFDDTVFAAAGEETAILAFAVAHILLTIWRFSPSITKVTGAAHTILGRLGPDGSTRQSKINLPVFVNPLMPLANLYGTDSAAKFFLSIKHLNIKDGGGAPLATPEALQFYDSLLASYSSHKTYFQKFWSISSYCYLSSNTHGSGTIRAQIETALGV
jgi:hypothetical protein